MREYGFIKVGSLASEMRVCDIDFNVTKLIEDIKLASKKGIKILCTPELSITGYTCGDLFRQDVLLEESLNGLNKIINATSKLDICVVVGMPLKHEDLLYNVGVVINKGKILGIVPKTFIPNNNEFYEKRWFSSSKSIKNKNINILGQDVIISPYQLFVNKNIKFAVEVCEDLWMPNCPSIEHSLNGATIILNPSASPEIIGKREYRRNLVSMTSAKEIGAYVYSSSGVNESSSDLVFSGHLLICENGSVLEESLEYDFSSRLVYTDIDVDRLVHDRINNSNFISDSNILYDIISFEIDDSEVIDRIYPMYPFVSSNEDKKKEICEEILQLQSSGLARRLKHINCKKTVIGISGGLDSTLAFLVIVEAYKKLGISNDNIIGVTMPGFGTTDRTYLNACNLVKEYGGTLLEVSIRDACIQHFKDINISIDDRSVTYENAQARERTQILMDLANKENALLVGTGDLSELILGWCTYNGDHMSMYAVNTGVPKTLVRHIVGVVSDNTNSKTLKDILDTPISPELLPPDKHGNITQETESKIGPYVLHDFFIYHFLRYGASPKKILFLAKHTFKNSYSEEEIKKWLVVFIKRFFTQQFKRNCLPDGVKVGSISVSPRGDLRIPSDASYNMWLKQLEEV